MERVISMHTDPEPTIGVGPPPAALAARRRIQLLAELSANHPELFDSLLAGGSIDMTTIASSGVVTLPSGRVGTNGPIRPAAIAPATPSQEAQTGSGVEERTLLKPNSDVRRDTLPSLTLQSEKNSKRGWLTSKSRKIANAARPSSSGTSQDAAGPVSTRQEVLKGPKAVQVAKDHAKPLENQPSAGLVFVPSASIWAQHHPWTEDKLAVLRDTCRSQQLVGFPAFTKGMTVDDVRDEVSRCLATVPGLQEAEYGWVGSWEDGRSIGVCARSSSMAGINLDRFFADGGLAILCPLDTDTDTDDAVPFLEAWALAIAPYEIFQAGGCKDMAFKARIDAGQISNGERKALVDRLVRKKNNGGSSPPSHPLDNLDWETPAQDQADVTSWNARMIAMGRLENCVPMEMLGPSPTNALDSLRRRINAVGAAETAGLLGTATGLSLVAEGAAATASPATTGTLGQAITMSAAPIDLPNTNAHRRSRSQTAPRQGSRVSARQAGLPPTPAGRDHWTPVDLTTPVPSRKRTPKRPRTAIELTPPRLGRLDGQPRLTSNSSHAGLVDIAESAGF